jgi:Kef-type K+ transport system membrane component KefB
MIVMVVFPTCLYIVIAGIILGPSVMGRIPHFQETIFPSNSLPFLNLVATFGLVFFLFQVGLEVDLRIVKKDWKQSLSIAVAGMALPFGLGAAVSVGLYKLQNEPSIPFSSFLLFLGVAMAITVCINLYVLIFVLILFRRFLYWRVYWLNLNYFEPVLE